MANDQISLPALILVIAVATIFVRWFLSSPATAPGDAARAGRGSQASLLRSREAAVEMIQQMFPQVDRRTVLWDLQRNGCNVQATTERILSGRLETPPQSFQPPPPPAPPASAQTSQPAAKQPDKTTQPDLITRYNLQDKIRPDTAETEAGKEKGWSSNRDERQELLRKRRDDMILAARRKMEAKIAAEKAAGAN